MKAKKYAIQDRRLNETLERLAMAADPYDHSGTFSLVSALIWASRTVEAEAILDVLIDIIKRLIDSPHIVTRKDFRDEVQRVANSANVTLPRIGIDTPDWPTPNVFASLLKSIYPPDRFPRVADVAAGDGVYSTALVEAGYKVTIIDPRGKRVPKTKLQRKKFLVRDASNFDLIVAIRPCGASQKVVRAAKNTPTIISPCRCKSVWPSGKQPTKATALFLREMDVKFRQLGAMFLTGEEALKRNAVKRACEQITIIQRESRYE